MAYYKVKIEYAQRAIADMRLRNSTECGHVLLDKKDIKMISFSVDETIEMLGLEIFDPETDIIANDVPEIDDTLPEDEDEENNLPEVEPEIIEEDESDN